MPQFDTFSFLSQVTWTFFFFGLIFLINSYCRFPKYEPILKGNDWGRFVPAQDHERMLELQAMGPHMKDEEGEFSFR